MRQLSTLLALAAFAGCHSPTMDAETDGGMNGGDSGMMSPEPGATDAPAPSAPMPPEPSTTTEDAAMTTGSAWTEPADPEDPEDPEDPGATTGPEPEQPWKAKGCPKIYAQDLLPTFEIEISKTELDKLEAEWKAAVDKSPPEHPLISFKYEDIVITDATARLRGTPHWWPEQGKMQLQISFNSNDKKGRFRGLRKLVLDAARRNESFLRDRLALAILQDVGIPTPCANNARLVLNGEYYGLFTSIEKLDKEFLQRRYEDPDGNLYKRASWSKKTNKSDPDRSDIDALRDATTVEELDEMMNLELAVLEWATEAVIPNDDGPWGGGLNFYLYNDSKTGFNLLPWDLDTTFTRLPYDTDPYTYIKLGHWGRPLYEITTDDPVWFQKYIEAIAYVLEHGYRVDVLHARMDTWAAQIATAAAEDPNKPFTTEKHLKAVQAQRDYVADRAAFIKTWLECWQNGGTKTKEGKCKPAP